MKKFIPLIVLIIFILLIIATVILKNSNDPKKASELKYIIHTEKYGNSFDYSKRGYYIDTLKMPNAPWFYIITMGEMPTGGYSIEVSEVKIDENSNVKVIVKENSPKARRSSYTGFNLSICLYRV